MKGDKICKSLVQLYFLGYRTKHQISAKIVETQSLLQNPSGIASVNAWLHEVQLHIRQEYRLSALRD